MLAKSMDFFIIFGFFANETFATVTDYHQSQASVRPALKLFITMLEAFTYQILCSQNLIQNKEMQIAGKLKIQCTATSKNIMTSTKTNIRKDRIEVVQWQSFEIIWYIEQTSLRTTIETSPLNNRVTQSRKVPITINLSRVVEFINSILKKRLPIKNQLTFCKKKITNIYRQSH